MGVGEVLGAVAGAVDALLPVAKFGYSIYQDQRDTSYQHNLQNKIFNREDNAIQRRMADLEAAGLNPNLAAGQGANAGQVVGRSSGQSVNTGGNVLDAYVALAQLAKIAEETKNIKAERSGILDSNRILRQNADWDLFTQARNLGYKAVYNPYTHYHSTEDSWDSQDELIKNGYIPFNSSPTNIDWEYQRGILHNNFDLSLTNAEYAPIRNAVNIGSEAVGTAVGAAVGFNQIGQGLRAVNGLKGAKTAGRILKFVP